MGWYAFQVRDFYDRPSQYRELKRVLTGDRYGFRNEDIFIWGDCEEPNIKSSYVFVRYDGDFQLLWSDLRGEKYVRSSEPYFPIPDYEIDAMKAEYAARPHSHVDIYDLVYVEKTIYSRLYGVVLKKGDAKGSVVVGFNFFTGPRYIEFQPDDLRVVRPLFEIWKFPL